MLTTEFSKRLAPFSLLIAKNAMAPSYKALGLSAKSVRGCAAFGVMEIDVDLPLSDDTVYVNAEEFIQVMKSLPDADLAFQVKDNALIWSCDRARGQLALMSDKIEIPTIPDALYEKTTAEVGEAFGDALNLAALAAGSTALLSIGLYGVSLVNDDRLEGYASDNKTVSTASLGPHVDEAPDTATLSPQALALVSAIVKDGSLFGFDEQAAYCVTETTRLAVNQVAPLKHDLKALMGRYAEEEIVAELNRDVIAQFIKRADALAEDKGHAEVSISIEKGAAKLAFQGGKSSSEEFYLVEGSKDISVAPVRIEARRMARALAHATDLIFDYAQGGNAKALVLRGDNGFRFVLSTLAS